MEIGESFAYFEVRIEDAGEQSAQVIALVGGEIGTNGVPFVKELVAGGAALGVSDLACIGIARPLGQNTLDAGCLFLEVGLGFGRFARRNLDFAGS